MRNILAQGKAVNPIKHAPRHVFRSYSKFAEDCDAAVCNALQWPVLCRPAIRMTIYFNDNRDNERLYVSAICMGNAIEVVSCCLYCRFSYPSFHAVHTITCFSKLRSSLSLRFGIHGLLTYYEGLAFIKPHLVNL